jgi:hypothetical protein
VLLLNGDIVDDVLRDSTESVFAINVDKSLQFDFIWRVCQTYFIHLDLKSHAVIHVAAFNLTYHGDVLLLEMECHDGAVLHVCFFEWVIPCDASI